MRKKILPTLFVTQIAVAGYLLSSSTVATGQGSSPPHCDHSKPINGSEQDFVPIKAGSIVFMKDPLWQYGGFGQEKDKLAGINTVEVDGAGNFYAVDEVQNQIKIWATNNCAGEVLEIIDTAKIVASNLMPLAKVRGIAVGAPGKPEESIRLLILDRQKKRDPESRIISRSTLQATAWKQLMFTDFKERPDDLTVDIHGRIVVAERNGTIEVLQSDGSGRDPTFGTDGVLVLSHFEGINTSSFKTVDTDGAGNIYVADKDNGRIIKISPEGAPLLSFGSRGEGSDQFRDQVEGVAVDWEGNVYGRDEAGHRYLVFDKTGQFLASFGERGSGPQQQENADEFAIDKLNHQLIIADDGNYRLSVHKMSPGAFYSTTLAEHHLPEFPIVQPAWIAGGVKGSAPGTEFDEPNEVGFDHNGNLWAGDVLNLRVQVFSAKGKFITTVGGSGTEPCQFVDPAEGKKGAEAIRSDSQNRVYIVDRGGQRINVYSGDDFSCIGSFTSPDIVLDDPTGLAIDAKDTLYVADQGTDKVHHFTFDGSGLRLVKTLQYLDGNKPVLAKVETLALDEDRDLLYASSEDESRVEVFQLSTGKYLDKHAGKLQVGAIPQNGRFVDDVEGIATDTVNDWLLMSDEDNGRIIIHDLGNPDLYKDEKDFAFLGAFGRIGSEPGQLLSADGITVSAKQGLVVVADQGNYRIQAFRIADIKAVLGIE